ncbi:MAG: hypothetical protein JKY90_03200 [Gammaproteobacteria bacterium]|nr:hypothetical protein [Gammaproteobacteria bacterium]
MKKKSIDTTIRALLLGSTLLLTACGGSSSTSATDVAEAPATAASPTLSFSQTKIFRFAWTDVTDATFYRLQENPDGITGFSRVGADIAQGTETVDLVVPLHARINAQYMLQSCNATGCIDSAASPSATA